MRSVYLINYSTMSYLAKYLNLQKCRGVEKVILFSLYGYKFYISGIPQTN